MEDGRQSLGNQDILPQEWVICISECWSKIKKVDGGLEKILHTVRASTVWAATSSWAYII